MLLDYLSWDTFYNSKSVPTILIEKIHLSARLTYSALWQPSWRSPISSALHWGLGHFLLSPTPPSTFLADSTSCQCGQQILQPSCPNLSPLVLFSSAPRAKSWGLPPCRPRPFLEYWAPHYPLLCWHSSDPPCPSCPLLLHLHLLLPCAPPPTCHTHGKWKLPGQGSNPCHRSDNRVLNS